MPVIEIVGVLMLVALGWLWLAGVHARDAAVQAARAACAAEGLMLLDDTVAATRTRPARDDEGRVRLQRAYVFEYSDSGDNRIRGSLVLLGREVVMLNVGLRPRAPTPPGDGVVRRLRDHL